MLPFVLVVVDEQCVGQRIAALFERVFSTVDPSRLHSVSLGSFRLPRDYFRRMVKLYPEERLFASPLEESDGMVSYKESLHSEIFDFCKEKILGYIPRTVFFPCLSGVEAS